jgi:WD40 repeat protein
MSQYFYGVEIVNVTQRGLGIGSGADRTDDSPHGKAFGGERNPDKLVYVFDASYCPAIGLLGVALSDGSLRLHNGRGHCVSVMNLPGVNSHLTSFSWDRSGERLVTTVATGHLISWHVHFGDVQGNGNAKAECMAIMEGGHEPGRPIFGAKYLGGEYEHLIVSWGIDGTLCLWDSYLQGNVRSPMAVLRNDDEYPIYAVDVHHEKQALAVAGGNDGGFIGTPLYLYDYKEKKEEKQEPESETKAK